MTTTRGLVSLPIIIVIGLLTGCGMSGATTTASAPRSTIEPTTAAPSQAPSVTPTIEPSPSAPSAAQPRSRFSADCDDVGQAVSGLWSEALPLTSTGPSFSGPNWLPGPATYTFAQAGDLYCEFGQGGADNPYATVVLVADGGDALEDRERTLGFQQSPLECSVDAGRGTCDLVQVIEGVYVSVNALVVAGDVATAERALGGAREALATVISKGVADPTWVPARDVIPIQSGCEQLLPPAQLSDVLGTPSLTTTRPSGGWGVEYWMLTRRWAADACIYLPEGGNPWEGPAYGQLTWLPGSEWAYDRAVEGTELNTTVGMDTDRALLNCADSEYYDCDVDILAGGNWIRYSISDDLEDSRRQQVAQAVADAIIGNVRR